jgi:hypothetical protein
MTQTETNLAIVFDLVCRKGDAVNHVAICNSQQISSNSPTNSQWLSVTSSLSWYGPSEKLPVAVKAPLFPASSSSREKARDRFTPARSCAKSRGQRQLLGRKHRIKRDQSSQLRRKLRKRGGQTLWRFRPTRRIPPRMPSLNGERTMDAMHGLCSSQMQQSRNPSSL